MDLTVVILNYNSRDDLAQSLSSIQGEGSTTLSLPYARITAEVIVVDNASDDGSAALVEAQFPWVRLVRSPRNGGFAFGNNLAFPHASGECILLLNPDALVSPGTFAGLLGVMADHPEAGVVGPKLLRADGSVHLACRRSFPTPEVALYRILGLSTLFPHSRIFGRYNLTYLDPDVAVEVDSVCGACMLVRREALLEAGPLDERFFMYGEDIDWCLRMQGLGWRVRYEPSIIVRHAHGGASRNRALQTNLHFFRAMDLFYRKHYLHKYNPALSALVLAGIYASLGLAVLRTLLTAPSRRRVGV